MSYHPGLRYPKSIDSQLWLHVALNSFGNDGTFNQVALGKRTPERDKHARPRTVTMETHNAASTVALV